MAGTYQIHPFSASTNFLPISIASTSSGTPDTIHVCSSTNYDEIWADGFNYGSDDAILTICIGGTSAEKRLIIPIPAGRGLVPIIKGLRFTGGITLSAYASSANVISVIGSVNRVIFV